MNLVNDWHVNPGRRYLAVQHDTRARYSKAPQSGSVNVTATEPGKVPTEVRKYLKDKGFTPS